MKTIIMFVLLLLSTHSLKAQEKENEARNLQKMIQGKWIKTDYDDDYADSSIIYVVKDIYMYVYDREGNFYGKSRFEVKYGICDYCNREDGKKYFYVLTRQIDIDTDVEDDFEICFDISLGESEMVIPNCLGRFTYYRRIE